MEQQQFLMSYGGNDYAEDYYSYNSHEDYYDVYDDELENRDQFYQSNMAVLGEPSFWNHLSFYQLCTQCVIPAVWSTGNLLGTTMFICIFFRLFIVINNKTKIVPESMLHIVCAICGVLPIIIFHEEGDLYQLLLQIVLFPVCCYILSIICILNSKRYSSIVFSAIVLLILFYYEFYSDDSKWQKIKSAHMLMSMKAMAVLFDVQSNELRTFPSVSQYSGYMMSAGTIYLGPFLTFQDYSNAFLLPVHWNKTKVCRVLWKIIVSLFNFVLSICVVDWLFSQVLFMNENSNSISSTFFTMYKQALEFRTGHYFVAYASAVFAIICGYNNEILVTRPLSVEWPQSLLHVVIHWNAPMHYWLKKYVFEEILKYGDKNKKHRYRIVAVGTTYFVSSLLHGLERKLSAVLLSLAAYTFVEHQMRTKLASRFPRTFCNYSKNNNFPLASKKYCGSSSNTWSLWCVNIMFTILNIIHLAYLGSIMDMTVNKSDNIADHNSFARWRHVSYFSHFIMLFMYFISIIL